MINSRSRWSAVAAAAVLMMVATTHVSAAAGSTASRSKAADVVAVKDKKGDSVYENADGKTFPRLAPAADITKATATFNRKKRLVTVEVEVADLKALISTDSAYESAGLDIVNSVAGKRRRSVMFERGLHASAPESLSPTAAPLGVCKGAFLKASTTKDTLIAIVPTKCLELSKRQKSATLAVVTVNQYIEDYGDGSSYAWFTGLDAAPTMKPVRLR